MTITATVDRNKMPPQAMSRTILNGRGARGRTAIVGRRHSTVFIMNTVGPGSQGIDATMAVIATINRIWRDQPCSL